MDLALGGAAQRRADADADADADDRELLERLIRVVCRTGPVRVTIPKISCEEIPWTELESMGFRKRRTYTGYAEFPGSRMH